MLPSLSSTDGSPVARGLKRLVDAACFEIDPARIKRTRALQYEMKGRHDCSVPVESERYQVHSARDQRSVRTEDLRTGSETRTADQE
jgi:hypothetical protein